MSAIDSNIRMRCRFCLASTKGDTCPLCLRGLTVCAECGYCYGCESRLDQRAAGEGW